MTQILQDIKDGMKVCDANGESLGEVEFVYFGTEAAEVSSPQPDLVETTGAVGEESWLQELAEAVSGDELPDVMVERLRRTGFVRVDGGLLQRDRYVQPGQIAAVTGGTVHLAPGAEENLIGD